MDFSFSRKEVSLAVTKSELYMIHEIFEQIYRRSQGLRKLTDSVNMESTSTVAK